jgi:phosphatidylinositol alpha-1,6-mannosyltransferase
MDDAWIVVRLAAARSTGERTTLLAAKLAVSSLPSVRDAQRSDCSMNLLVVTWNYPPRRGGIENLMGSLCTELHKTHSVRVITSYARNAAPDENVFRAPLPGLVAFAFYAIWRGAALLARDKKMGVVFGGSAVVAPLVLLLARAFGRRAILQVHGLDVIYRNSIYQLLCVRWLKSCDHVVANSRYTATLAASKGVSQKRLTVIPPGVRREYLGMATDVPAAKQSFGMDDNKIILFVGRLAKRKGVQEFIENSLPEIVQKVPQVLFVIVGDNPTASLTHRDDVAGEIRALTGRLRIDKHVRLLGALSDQDLMKIYQACDVVVLPALDLNDDVEGFGIVGLEAAAAGKPVVATRVGGIPDAVEDGKSGVLVAPRDYPALSHSIAQLLDDPGSRSRLGQYGRCRVAHEFSWPRIAGLYENMFSAAVQKVR